MIQVNLSLNTSITALVYCYFIIPFTYLIIFIALALEEIEPSLWVGTAVSVCSYAVLPMYFHSYLNYLARSDTVQNTKM